MASNGLNGGNSGLPRSQSLPLVNGIRHDEQGRRGTISGYGHHSSAPTSNHGTPNGIQNPTQRVDNTQVDQPPMFAGFSFNPFANDGFIRALMAPPIEEAGDISYDANRAEEVHIGVNPFQRPDIDRILFGFGPATPPRSESSPASTRTMNSERSGSGGRGGYGGRLANGRPRGFSNSPQGERGPTRGYAPRGHWFSFGNGFTERNSNQFPNPGPRSNLGNRSVSMPTFNSSNNNNHSTQRTNYQSPFWVPRANPQESPLANRANRVNHGNRTRQSTIGSVANGVLSPVQEELASVPQVVNAMSSANPLNPEAPSFMPA